MEWTTHLPLTSWSAVVTRCGPIDHWAYNTLATAPVTSRAAPSQIARDRQPDSSRAQTTAATRPTRPVAYLTSVLSPSSTLTASQRRLRCLGAAKAADRLLDCTSTS